MHSIEAVTAPGPAVRSRADTGDVPVDGDLVAATAVLAHTLLNSIAVVRGGTELLARHHESLPDAERHEWYRRIDDHAEFIAIALERMAQGRLAEALAVSELGCQPTRRPRAAIARARTTIQPV